MKTGLLQITKTSFSYNLEISETNKKLSNCFSCTHSVFSRIVHGSMSIVPVFFYENTDEAELNEFRVTSKTSPQAIQKTPVRIDKG